MAKVAENIIAFLQKSMVNWKTELTSCGETLGLVDIKHLSRRQSVPPYLQCLHGTFDMH